MRRTPALRLGGSFEPLRLRVTRFITPFAPGAFELGGRPGRNHSIDPVRIPASPDCAALFDRAQPDRFEQRSKYSVRLLLFRPSRELDIGNYGDRSDQQIHRLRESDPI